MRLSIVNKDLLLNEISIVRKKNEPRKRPSNKDILLFWIIRRNGKNL